jgi:hypothetical protein
MKTFAYKAVSDFDVKAPIFTIFRSRDRRVSTSVDSQKDELKAQYGVGRPVLAPALLGFRGEEERKNMKTIEEKKKRRKRKKIFGMLE